MAASRSPKRSPAQTGAPGELPRTRIYVVDDHPLIRKALVQLISGEPDMEICGEAGTADVAFKEISTLRPDVAVIDLSPNGSAGVELIKKIRQLDATIGIIVLAMHSKPDSSSIPGASSSLIKEEAPEQILRAIRLTHGGWVLASGGVAGDILRRIPNGPAKKSAGTGALTREELAVAELIAMGNTTNEIAVRLHASIKAIERHRAQIRRKLRVENSADLVQLCLKLFQTKVEKSTQKSEEGQR